MEKIYYNGDIITLEENSNPEAVYIRDARIIKVGNKEELDNMASKNVEYIDLQGHTLMPAFLDAHSHFSGFASSLTQADLREATSFTEIIETIQRFIIENKIPAGKWVQADGYDPDRLGEKIHPTKKILDEATLKHPLLVKHISGHMGVLNTRGLETLGITMETKAPDGGRIGKNEQELTGYLEENAYMEYVQKIPMASQEELFDCLQRAQQIYAGYGITTIQEGFIVPTLVPLLQTLMKQQMLRIDLIGYLDISHAAELSKQFPTCIKEYRNHFKIGGYKTFLDGSPQGRTAWMRTPYRNLETDTNGEAKNYGVGTQTDDEIREKIRYAVKKNMQLLVHCNGDAACDQYIRMLTFVEKEENVSERQGKNLRPVMIHAQLLDLDQLPAVKRLHLIPSFFVAHVYQWGDVHIRNLGFSRASRISPTRSASSEKICFTFHQDSPVIKPNMLQTIWCAVNRITREGVLLGEQERIEPIEALKAVTKNAAYQYFEEEQKGTIREGKLADLIITDKNLLKVDPLTIKDIKILETIKEGTTIYRREDME